MSIDKLLKKEKKDIKCDCKYLRRCVDKNGKAWQICYNCYSKEIILPRKG